jgi:hypothetical protein
MTREMYKEIWWGKLKGGNHLKGLGVDGRIIRKCALKGW